MSLGLRLTASEYDRMVARGAFDHLHRKIELIRGQICAMNPAGPLHDDLIQYLIAWSSCTIDRNKIRVRSQTGVNLDELDSRPEPDLMWVDAGRYRDRHPTAAEIRLAIEVADSSLQRDLIDKASLYAAAGIVEYWIVDAQSGSVHVFRDPHNGAYSNRSVSKVGEQLAPLEPCSTPLDLADLFEGD